MRLPKLPNVTQLNPLVTRILGQNAGLSTLQGTNSYLVGFPGFSRILIDTTSAGTCLPIYLNILEAELRRNRTSNSQPPLAAILLTHWHPDHSAAVSSDLVRNIHISSDASPVPVYKCAGGPCLKSLEFYSGPVKPMVEGQTFSIPVPLSSQDDFASETPNLTVLSTPGHTMDHTCLLLRANGVPLCLFTGDLILGTYRVFLKIMLSGQLMQNPSIYPAHGEVVGDALAKVTEYIQHRHQRIRKVRFVVPRSLARAATNNLRQALFWLSSHPGSPHRRIYVRSGPRENRKDPQYLCEYVQLAVDEFYKCPSGNVSALVASDWDWMWCKS
ncbi:unnamed protein product [Schistocephalus solidus]|uniref:Lactamase_B domain-containing protein n=1 Tax=Schistocephalus solidus TaxID=70667 RepID=A0A183TE60_SCHSO|nr:unnamed protein product [Schistocephalus solidus]